MSCPCALSEVTSLGTDYQSLIAWSTWMGMTYGKCKLQSLILDEKSPNLKKIGLISMFTEEQKL